MDANIFSKRRKCIDDKKINSLNIVTILYHFLNLVVPIFGKHISLSSQKINLHKEAKKQAKQHMLSAGIAPSDNVWVVSFVKLFLSLASTVMHTICLDLFLHRYNLDLAILLEWPTTQ